MKPRRPAPTSMEGEPAAKRQRFTSNIVTVKVGQDPCEDFFMHEIHLKKSSAFFKAALEKKWKEGQSLVIELPEDDADAFSKYAAWLYYDELEIEFPSQYLSQEDCNSQTRHVEYLLADCYIFGEKVLDPTFCNTIVRSFVEGAEYRDPPKPIGVDVSSYLYEHTASDSPIRKFLVDSWIIESRDGHELGDEHELHPQFSKDLLKAFLSKGKTTNRSYSMGGPLQRKSWYKAV